MSAACAAMLLSGACGTQPAGDPDILVSVINVTPFSATVRLSAVRENAVDTVVRSVGPSGSADVVFVCVDQVVVGDPLEPTVAGIIIDADGVPEEVEPFALLVQDAFVCGDVIEIIISGDSPDNFAVDVFTFDPP